MKSLIHSILLMSILSTGPVIAENDSPVRFANTAQKQNISVDEDGVKRITLTSTDLIVPGDTVVYTSTFTNIGTEDVSNIVVSNPIPANTQYIVFSAKGKTTRVSFSVDGGKTFAAPAQLTVVDNNGIKQTAKPKDYTDIRWVYQGTLSAGSSSSVSFNVSIL
jgi:uncharacterized repeat protein (TIGR01451 family)